LLATAPSDVIPRISPHPEAKTMAWLGKLLGGAVGFALGGALGALVGVALGHNIDRSSRAARGRGGADSDLLGAGADFFDTSDHPDAPETLDPRERTQTAFFTATFAVMGHLAKADGRVTRDEVRLASRVMDEMRLSATHRQLAERLFRAGRSPDFPVSEVLDQFRRECRYSAHLVTMFVEILLHAAYADGALHPEERALLESVCGRLRLPAGELERLEAMVRAEHHARSGKPSDTLSPADAYAILGVDETCPDADLKRAYRRMMNRHHPDKLVAKGLPEEMMRVATEKTREIKAAYDRLKEVRGL